MIVSSFLAFLISVSLIPVIIKVCARLKLYDSIDARKIHSGNIPRLGGVAVFLSFAVAMVVYNLFFSTEKGFGIEIVFGGFLIFGMGLADDVFDLGAKLKLLIQCVTAFIIVFSGYHFKQILFFKIPPFFAGVITFLWIVGVTNAFNLIDGLDCLCGGIALMVLMTLYAIFGRSALNAAACSLMLSGAIAGFLLYNRPPAKIFLGDSGSQFLGFVVAVCPLFDSTSNYEYNKVLIMFLLMSIPVTDIIAAIWRRKREHRSFFTPDRFHVHHKLLNIGFSKVAVLMLLLSLQAIICVSVCFSMYLKLFRGTMLLFVVYCFVILFFAFLHYANRAVTLKNIEMMKKKGDNDC